MREAPGDSGLFTWLPSLVRLREQSQLPRQTVVRRALTGGIEALVQVLQVAGIHREALIDAVADHVAVADVLGPRWLLRERRARAGRECVGEGIGKRRPGAVERV